jgi:P2 family phage contractile tail tube protein
MASLNITTLWNGNVSLNGVNGLGELSEYTVPQPKRKMMDYKSTGMAAAIDIPVGWDKLESELKWTSFDPDMLAQLASQSGAVALSIQADAQVISSMGMIQDVPVLCNLYGPVTDPGPISVKGQENFEMSTKISVWHIDLSFGGAQIYLFDAFSNQFVVNGVDQLAAFRANIGG